MVVATTALVIAAGTGGGLAASKIGTGDLKNGAVSTPKVKKNAITGAKVRNNTLTGADIKNGSLRLADFNRRDRARLQGTTGPQGPGGPQGTGGPTGAPGLIDLNKLSQVRRDATVPPGDEDYAIQLDCPPGAVALSGGFSVQGQGGLSDDNGARVRLSHRVNANDWIVLISTRDATSPTRFEVFVTCVRA